MTKIRTIALSIVNHMEFQLCNCGNAERKIYERNINAQLSMLWKKTNKEK